MKFEQLNLNLNNLKFKNEREFHKYLYNYLKQYVPKVEYEKYCDRKIRPDIYFNYNEKEFIIECKYISQQFSHTDIATLLIQMLNYKDFFYNDSIYLVAFYGEDHIIEKKFGNAFLYPTAQLFASFGIYFLKWSKGLPKHFNCEENVFLSYSNGSGMIHLSK